MSLRTIYRDIETLINVGVPIIGEVGVGYSIMEDYRLPPIMFTQEEAIAFIMAEKIEEKFVDTQNIKNFETALFKVKSVLRNSEKKNNGRDEQLGSFTILSYKSSFDTIFS